jgi:hypothetical protein
MAAYLKIRPRSKKRTIWSFALAVVLLSCMYIGVFHLHHYQRYVVFPLVTSIAVISATQLQELWLEPVKIQFFRPLVVLFTMILLWIGGQLTLKLQAIYLTYELSKYGEITNGQIDQVVDKSSFLNPRYVLVSYKFKGKTWLQKLDDENGIYQKNDVLKIKLASREPDIIEILGLIKKNSPVD